MQVTFQCCPDSVRVGDIGESVAEADDSFRRQFFILVLAAARKREIPLRNKSRFKIPQESLDITETQTRDFATVSYTHLDVYKRQGLVRSKAAILRLSGNIKEPAEISAL